MRRGLRAHMNFRSLVGIQRGGDSERGDRGVFAWISSLETWDVGEDILNEI